jgi:hypothetical protein
VKRFLKLLLVLLLTVSFPQPAYAWGYTGHRIINDVAIDAMPLEVKAFFIANRQYLVEHSGDPDLAAEDNEVESRNHYIDLDLLDQPPFKNIPHDWDEAVQKFGYEKMLGVGRLPWRIEEMTEKMSEAMRAGDWEKTLATAAWLSHYVADAHMPLHTTKNYKGQFTGNVINEDLPVEDKHVHFRFEIRLIERNLDEIKVSMRRRARPATFLEEPGEKVWQILLDSYKEIDDLLKADLECGKLDPTFGDKFYEAFKGEVGGLAEGRLAASAQAVASFWYTAWVNAGRPRLPREPIEVDDTVAGQLLGSPPYFAAVESEIFHNRDCPYIQQIRGSNLVWFWKREDAVNSGRRPCKACQP